MTVKLGQLTLDSNLQLEGLLEAPRVAVKTYRSLGGESSPPITMPLSDSGRLLRLVARQEGEKVYGSFTAAQLEDINYMAALAVPVSLVHPQGSFTVLVISAENPAQVMEVVDPLPEDLYTATINLIEV